MAKKRRKAKRKTRRVKRNPTVNAAPKKRRRRRSPIMARKQKRRHYRRVKRNPDMTGILIDGIVAGGGAAATFLVSNILAKLFNQESKPHVKNGIRAAIAVALGVFGPQYLDRNIASALTSGAFVAVMLGVAKSSFQIDLAGLGADTIDVDEVIRRIDSGVNGIGAYDEPRRALAYVPEVDSIGGEFDEFDDEMSGIEEYE